ncbi:MAG: gliding motility-associated C-terminal domain-containing protein [Raineya sp.]|nr:gliding motility-associated C-terminal domain-containing protein [Raineya sp.]
MKKISGLLLLWGLLGSWESLAQSLVITPKSRTVSPTPIIMTVTAVPCATPAAAHTVTISGFTPASVTYSWQFVSKVPNEAPFPASPSGLAPTGCGSHPAWARRLQHPGPGVYKWRLCATNGSQTACDTLTVVALPPSNIPPVVQIQKIDTLFKPTAGKKMGFYISDPVNNVTYTWFQDAGPTAFVPAGGTIPIGQIKSDSVAFPELASGVYTYRLRAFDGFVQVDSSETFLVYPKKSHLKSKITPVPSPQYTPINNLQINGKINQKDIWNDRVKFRWEQAATNPTQITLAPYQYIAESDSVQFTTLTLNSPLAYGMYKFYLRAVDEYYETSHPSIAIAVDSVEFAIQPPQSNLDVTVNPANEVTIDPYNDYTFSGEVTGINPNSDVIRTYWHAENGNPASIALPHTMSSPNVISIGTTTFNQSVTMNQRITEGIYEFWFVAKDIFYNVGDSAKVRIIVKPGESTFALTIEPSPEKRVVKTPEGFIFNDGEAPQNAPFSVKGRVTGISDKTDYVRTYWRMQYEPELPDQDEQLQPTLPHTASAMKSINLGTTNDESEVVFNLNNCSAGTYTLWFVARDVFYNTADSVSAKVVVTKPVSIEPAAMFSPNGDGQNDVWFVKNIESFPFLGVKIINERGEIVFETDSVSRLPEKGWDGRRRDGKLAAEGAYYYQFYDARDQKVFNIGSFVLLR